MEVTTAYTTILPHDSDTPGGGHKKIKGPAHMVEGGHHLRKAPNPHPPAWHEINHILGFIWELCIFKIFIIELWVSLYQCNDARKFIEMHKGIMQSWVPLLKEWSMILGGGGGGGGLTRNATEGQKGGSKLYIWQILTKNRGRNMTFSSFLLTYRGRNYANFPETWKRGVEMAEHM